MPTIDTHPLGAHLDYSESPTHQDCTPPIFGLHHFWVLDPGDAIQLVLGFYSDDIRLSLLHFNPREARAVNG